ncbi:MAG: glycosyltransferase [Candidatus Firestonebacteria bacterium]|nr:glycosyltransferase [Candidatus Firestonebacteria bacterium]
MKPNEQALEYSVIMPAFNEGRHLEENVRQTVAVMEELGKTFEIVVVDDCSLDNSCSLLQDLAARIPALNPVYLNPNQGKGHALRAGFMQSRGRLVFFLDADLELHPRQFAYFLEIMSATGVDVVIGSKRHPESVLHYPWRRRLMSSVYFWMVKLLFGLPVKDTQTGIKLFRREVLAKAFPKSLVKTYAFDLELLILAHHYGYRIAEAPVTVEYKAQFGHIRPLDILRILWDTLAIFYRLYLRRYYDRASAGKAR